jgi:ribosomal protein L29
MAALLGSSGSVLPGSHSCFRRGAVAFPAAHVVTTPRIRTLRAVRAEEAKEGAAAKRKPTKASEFRQLNASQIDEEVQKSKRALLDLRIAQRTKQVRHPASWTPARQDGSPWLPCHTETGPLSCNISVYLCSHLSPATSPTTK